jgi:putative oxidoreductase
VALRGNCYIVCSIPYLQGEEKPRMKFLSSHENNAFLLMRLVSGFLIGCHGAQKLFGVPGDHKTTVTLLVVAAAIELVGGALVFLGLFTRVAAFVLSGEMAVAYFMQHAPHGFFPIVNGGELAVAYCFVFLYIATRGGGRFSFGR